MTELTLMRLQGGVMRDLIKNAGLAFLNGLK